MNWGKKRLNWPKKAISAWRHFLPPDASREISFLCKIMVAAWLHAVGGSPGIFNSCVSPGMANNKDTITNLLVNIFIQFYFANVNENSSRRNYQTGEDHSPKAVMSWQ
jgi:hypothetical protein